MRRSIFVLLGAFQRCWSRHHGFSIHEDFLAHPQFEIIFSDAYIPETEAESLLDLGFSPKIPTESNVDVDDSLAAQTPQTQSVPDASTPTGATDSGQLEDEYDEPFEREVAKTYELMNVPPHKYLCTIPVIEPPAPQNQTASELAKAEEARELVRATSSGWDLIRDLDGSCLYFVSGWWSYEYCFGIEVVQYHAIQASPKDGVPIRDPNLQHYVLGRDTDEVTTISAGQYAYQHNDQEQGHHDHHEVDPKAGELAEIPSNMELIQKGNNRYLVQRLEDGTTCDLTGRPRTIEIQYHCSPVGTSDRIGWIKEVTTCAYLMAIYTPRLCKDLAFLPPKPTKAHAITCREIFNREQEQEWLEQKIYIDRVSPLLDAASSASGASEKSESTLVSGGSESRHQQQQPKGPQKPITVGSIQVGSRKILSAADHDGQEARLAPPRSFARQPSSGDSHRSKNLVIASGKSKERGGAVDLLPDETIEDLNLDPQMVERVRQELKKYAGDHGWRLEIMEQGGEVEMIAIVIGDEDEEEELGVDRSAARPPGKQGRDGGHGGGKEEKHRQQQQQKQQNTMQGQAQGQGQGEGQQHAGAYEDGGEDYYHDDEDYGDPEDGSEEEFFQKVRDEL